MRVAAESSSMARGFAQFLLRGKVVDLAVAVIIGGAAGSFVTAFIKDIFTPFLSMIFGSHAEFAVRTIEFHGSILRYGEFINSLLSFLAICAAVYFFVIVPTNKLVTNAYFEAPPDPATRKCPECLSEIPKGATRCAHCTAKIEPLLDEPSAATT